ncbi:Dopamine N-acetyltransferase [Frankliniella fusca]|uniref:Dopamine N-acetyltransferase n=1 Tax=Frankliniella fusca TaxID=407009 RepID=A0AAE1HLR5_9NEOP|nr:Dopamine N-acetyltransferase [Frankliniella fusca]
MTTAELRVVRVAADDQQTHEAVLDVLTRGFFPRESACLMAGVAASPEGARQLLDLVSIALKDGLSVAAYLGDEMVGCSVNKLQVKPAPGEASFFERFADERAPDPAANWTMHFMMRVDARADLFAEAGAGCDRLLELMFLAVVPEAGRRGVGVRLAAETVAVAREHGLRAVSAIFTSDHSRAIGRRLGFRELAVAEHADFQFDGKSVLDRLSPAQQRSVLVILNLT